MSFRNSYIVVSLATGKPVLETWNRKLTEAINLDNYRVYTAHEWLCKFNRSVRGVKHDHPLNPS